MVLANRLVGVSRLTVSAAAVWAVSLRRKSDITQAILDGRQPCDLTTEKLLEHSRLPLAWHDQRIVLGFA